MSRRSIVSQTGSTQPAPPIHVLSPQSTNIADSVQYYGTFQITIGQESVLHPRCRIDSTYGSIILGRRCIVEERSILGASPSDPNLVKVSNLRAGSGGVSTPTTAVTTPTGDKLGLSHSGSTDGPRDSNPSLSTEEGKNSGGGRPGLYIGDYVTVESAAVIEAASHLSSTPHLGTLSQSMTQQPIPSVGGKITSIGEGTILKAASRIGNSAQIGKYCIIASKVVIPPGSIIPDHTFVGAQFPSPLSSNPYSTGPGQQHIYQVHATNQTRLGQQQQQRQESELEVSSRNFMRDLPSVDHSIRRHTQVQIIQVLRRLIPIYTKKGS